MIGMEIIFVYLQGHPENGPRIPSDDFKEKNRGETSLEKDASASGPSTWSLIRSVRPRRDRNQEQSIITLKMNKTILMDAFVKMIISDGQHFQVVSESGMKMLVGPLLEALNLSLDEEMLRQEVMERARKIRESISEDVCERLVSLKVSVICRKSRPFIGISVHYVKGGRKQFRILGVKEISTVHSGRELKQIIWCLLSDYGIGKEQLYTMTIDNSSNSLKAFRKTNSRNENESDTENECNDEENNGDKETAITVSVSLRDAFVSDKEIDSESLLNVNIECLTSTIQSIAQSTFTMQQDSKKLVEKARYISNKLRTKGAMAILKSKGTRLAIVDRRSRWKSTFAMVKRLHDNELRQVINEMGAISPELNVSQTEWNKMENFIQAFTPLMTFSARTDDPQLTIGDFYKEWLKCKMETKKLNTEYARHIAEHMKKAEEKMKKNKAFLAAVYLDPRIRVILTGDQTEMARQHLERVWMAKCNVSRLQTETKNPNDEETELGISLEDDLEIFLRSKDRNTVQTISSVSFLSSHFKSYEERQREKSSANVIQFWETFGQTRSELHQLAMIALACPVNEVGVERIWSGVRFMLNPSYIRLPEDIIDDIILVNTNQSVRQNCH